ncbi:MAG: sensor histidine kinase [Nocardioides sp.]|nr:sensor histidine kinase [Nocardioides sp.]
MSVLASAGLVMLGLYVARRAVAGLLGRSEEAYAELAQEEALRRGYQARTHEVASTLAGIRSASDLLSAGGLEPERSEGLHAMIGSELRRLERVLQAPPLADVADATPEPDVIDVDLLLRTAVTAHLAKGTTVAWQPGGELALGSADDLAEVVNVLLDNAARHGDGSATIALRSGEGSTLEILVSDTGPGVAPEVRSQLFGWGMRSTASPGQGIGLHTARSLMERQGGYLRLADAGGDGAPTTFAVGIPALRVEDLVDEFAGLACEIELGVSGGVAA